MNYALPCALTGSPPPFLGAASPEGQACRHASRSPLAGRRHLARDRRAHPHRKPKNKSGAVGSCCAEMRGSRRSPTGFGREPLQHVQGQDPDRAGSVAVLFEVMVDRRGWPAVVRSLLRITAVR